MSDRALLSSLSIERDGEARCTGCAWLGPAELCVVVSVERPHARISSDALPSIVAPVRAKPGRSGPHPRRPRSLARTGRVHATRLREHRQQHDPAPRRYPVGPAPTTNQCGIRTPKASRRAAACRAHHAAQRLACREKIDVDAAWSKRHDQLCFWYDGARAAGLP